MQIDFFHSELVLLFTFLEVKIKSKFISEVLYAHIIVENVLDYVAFHNHEIWQSENFMLIYTLSWSQSGSVNTFQNETF